MFSPCQQEPEVQTPDTSDHSSDDYNFGKKSEPEIEVKPEPESHEQEEQEVQESAHDKEATQELEADRKQEASHELSTDPDYQAVYHPHMTFGQLLKAHRSIERAVKYIKNNCNNKEINLWRYKCALYAFLFRRVLADSKIKALLSFNNVNDYVCQNLVDGLQLVYKYNYTRAEAQALFLVLLHDATKAGLDKWLPSKDVDQIVELSRCFFPKFYFTEQELTVVQRYINQELSPEEVVQLLPLRSKKEIQAKVTQSGGPKMFPTVVKQENDKPNQSKLKPKPKVKLEEPEKVIIPLDSDTEDCIANDLTIDGLKAYFADAQVKKVILQIKENRDMEALPFTAGEKGLLKTLVKSGVNEADIYDKFPCRSLSYMDNKISQVRFVSTRQTRFKNEGERLLYEAKWVSYSQGETKVSERSRRRDRRALEQSFEEIEKDISQVQKRIKKSLTPEEEKQREELKVQRMKKIKEAQERKELEKQKLREEALRKKENQLQTNSSSKEVAKKPVNNELKLILAGAEHFQSVIGDRKKVEEGQKRNRIKAERFDPTPEPLIRTDSRHLQKRKLKQIFLAKQKNANVKGNEGQGTGIKKVKADAKSNTRKFLIKKESIEGEPDDEEIEDDIEEDSEEDESEEDESDTSQEEEEEEVQEEEAVEISPYDPVDINSDSMVSLNGRQFFVADIYCESPSIPVLEFVHVDENETKDGVSAVKACMTDINNRILLDDSLATDLIKSHRRNYKDLPISFPTVLDTSNGELNINESNKVRVRFLLYPQHTEQFLLASPKSNELDPVYEIMKLFMIHYCLYFSHSEEIKRIISEEYCHGLETAIENNDFAEFMFVIDKWNELMLRLSPNTEAVERILQAKEDINSEIRQYLSKEEIKEPTPESIKLSSFYSECMSEQVSPQYQLVQDEGTEIERKEFVPSHPGEVEAPTNVLDIETELKPENYNSFFYKRLQEKTEISRYAVQQILLRVYSRVVSTDSRKLRSYKAFTAEVYGELLPSFTSEVLEKVNLLPSQKFYDLGSGVGNTTFQAALEYGASISGGCELMNHASKLTTLQEGLIQKHLAVFGIKPLSLDFALSQSFVDNERVRDIVLDCDVLIINNYLFDGQLNSDVGKLLYGIRPGTKIVSLRNFISPRYRATGDTAFDYFKVEKHEMSDYLSVSWTANKVPYYISTVQDKILPEYLGRDETPEDSNPSTPFSRAPSDDGLTSGDLTPLSSTAEADIGIKHFLSTSEFSLI